MRRSTTQPAAQIEKWTEEDVYRWLLTEVKVQKSCADRFIEEEVSGDSLVDFTKTDILDMGIKHGPAVKIISYLEALKDGSQRDQFPAYVEHWTKEQVKQWLLQHVNVYSKYVERFLEEDVSGDCLACFKKQDFMDLNVKSGPAVKILAKLSQLNNNPEPTLQMIPQYSTEEQEATNPNQPEAQSGATIKQTPSNATESEICRLENESATEKQPSKKDSKQKIQPPKPQDLGARRKENHQTSAQAKQSKINLEIQKILEGLSAEQLKKFHYYLTNFQTPEKPAIPHGKLEDRDTMDTAKLITDHYNANEAVRVTVKILQQISESKLAEQLKITMGQLEEQVPSIGGVKKETNQGEKLKNLLTCGGNSLDNYDIFVVVVNKSSPQQVQYLQFLKKLKLFCVLDYDPNSNTEVGLCHSYRDSNWANLHNPSEYQGEIDMVMKKMCCKKQINWVFCNGRHDLDEDSNRELDYRNWLRRSCRDVEQMVSFICNPEVLLHGRSLIIFLLLSPVNSEKDPMFDTYKAFLKHVEEEIIIHICESESTYEKWRELIQDKCDFDIDPLSIYELSLREINGTVMALGPMNNSPERLLPSSDSSFVVLNKKEEAFLPALDILCLNQCENTYEENSLKFQAKKLEVEVEFYRGGKVSWWNFFFGDKDKEKPFIKRQKYEQVKKMIRLQLKDSKNMCVLLNLFHDPGCGGTTLAMHVLWDLRQEVRCAVLLDNALPKTEVAVQVVKLMNLESGKPFPVLLLVDDSKEKDNTQELVNCIPKVAETYLNVNEANALSCKVIILNCVRSQSPKDQYRRHHPSQFITASLTSEEQKEFEKKLNELRETHETPENFYSFMIMKSNFDKKYIEDLAHNSLENFNFSLKEAQLFAFLALLNTYVADSQIALSLCEDFLGIKMIRWQDQSVLCRMEPYSKFLIMDTFENWGHKGIRIIHRSIASACLEELDRTYSLKASDITLEILHCDLLFSDGVVKQRFMDTVQQMLVERQFKKDGVDREPFSGLIRKIHSEEEGAVVTQVFVKASSRFLKSASIPQALARYLYIKENDFPEALKWAEKAKNMKENQFTFDTIGNIHKSNLKSNLLKTENKATPCNPEELNTNIKIASNAISAFKRAQELANTVEETEQEAADDESDDYPRKSYNVKGYVSVVEIALLVINILSRLPFFEVLDPMKKRYFLSFLQKALPITSVYKEENEYNKRYEEIIQEHEHFLQNLKTEVKQTFELIECFYTYMKGSNLDVHRRTVCDLFKTYVGFFCTEPEEMERECQNKHTLNLKIKLDERRLFLEKNQADTFAGILLYLDKPAEEIERITESYAFLQEQQQFIGKKQKTKETINYILSIIVLNILNPNSKHAKSYSHLSSLLLKTLQDVGLGHPFPDPYYLALLLFWPRPTEVNTEIATYVKAILNASRGLARLFRNRSTVAFLYLGKEDKVERLVSKPQLDQKFKVMRSDLAQLWRSGEIFKEKAIINCLQRISGTIEHGGVFARYGKLKIPVRPALIDSVRAVHSTEKVSFYLGFAINGPLAYDIQYEN